MERTPFNTLESKKLFIREACVTDSYPDGHAFGDCDLVLIQMKNGKEHIVATVHRDEIFDHNGNRFSF